MPQVDETHQHSKSIVQDGLELCGQCTAVTLGEKIRELLLQHGDFKTVEIELVKTSEQLAQNDTKGGWYTVAAMAQKGFTELHGLHHICHAWVIAYSLQDLQSLK